MSAEPDGWEQFWTAAPRKEGKAPAKAAYAKAIKKPGVTPATLFDGITAYAARMAKLGTPREKIKMPQGWLNDERWNDETTTAPAQPERRKGWWEQ